MPQDCGLFSATLVFCGGEGVSGPAWALTPFPGPQDQFKAQLLT